MIKAPYNFVPLENAAFYPEWANHISQDIPFEDGVSGSIEYTMEAKTPIFVRNGYTDRNNPDATFSHTTDGRYFIPGTSVKGEIRNVLEILSFGKMTRVQDARFGIRDLNGVDKENYVGSILNEHCGWLYKDERGEYRIKDCGTPGRIKTSDLSDELSHFMSEPSLDWNLFCQRSGCTKAENEVKDSVKEEIKRSSLLKYFVYGYSLTQLLGKDLFADTGLNYSFSKVDIPHRKLYRRKEDGDRRGTIVLTGQPNSTKKYDFIFFDNGKTIDVQDDIIADFKSIHKNNLDFKYVWEPRLESGKMIPVFFTLKNEKVDAIGLSGMFRIPSANFIRGAIPAALQSDWRKDLAECIFGTADKKLGSLKGRVFFSPAFANDGTETLGEVRTTLSSPKPSYGPLYVKDGTWNDSNARIKGRKRYPVRESVWSNEIGNENTQTVFRPLAEGTLFSGKIYFHNLRQCELGALISALTFNGHAECFHSIGEAKPLGYGKVETRILKISDLSVDKINVSPSGSDVGAKVKYYLDLFKKMMAGFYSSENNQNMPESLSQLFAMAEGINADQDSLFRYMQLSTIGENDFVTYKSKNLELFTEITQNSDKNANAGDWIRKSQSDLSSEIANKFGVDAIKLEIKNLLDNGSFDLAYKRLSEYCCEGSKLNAEYKSVLNGELVKIRADVLRLQSDARDFVDNRNYASAAQCYRKIVDYNIPEYRDVAKEALNLCENVYPKVESLIFNGDLSEAKNVVDNNNQSHTDRLLNSFYDEIVKAEETIAGAEIQNKLKEIERLWDCANDSLMKSGTAEGEEKKKFIQEAISSCDEALQINVNCYNMAPLLELKHRCEAQLTRLSNAGQSLEEAFNNFTLASMAAFVGRVKRWMTDGGVSVLNETQLAFLGGIVKDNLETLKSDAKKKWKVKANWEKEFKNVLPQGDIDKVFVMVFGATEV